MSSMIAVAYPDEATADQALATLKRLQDEDKISIRDAVIAINDGGTIRIEQSRKLTGRGALEGAIWGGLLGLVFLMPVTGIAVGAAGGTVFGKFTDVGIDDRFVKEMGSLVKPGMAALVLLAHDSKQDEVIAEMQQFGGRILRSNLDDDVQEKIQAALARQPGQSGS